MQNWIASLIITAVTCLSYYPLQAQSALHIDANNSPYYFNNGYSVPQGDSLTLHPGAVVIVGDNESITVHGIFRSLGSSSDPVHIKGENPSIGWGVLDIRNTSDSLIMMHTQIEEGRLAVNDCPIRLFETHIINNQVLQWNDMVFRVWFSDIQMSHSSITGSNQGEGLICHDCINPTITNCYFNKIPDAIELINCNSGLIRGNLFYDMNDDAIDLNHCSGVRIDSNLIYNVSNRGLEIGSELFGSCTDIFVAFNCFFNCSEAINFKEGSTGSVVNNTFYKNEFALTTLSAVGFDQEVVLIENCIFEQNVTDVYNDTNAFVTVQYSCFSGIPLSGKGNFHGNPLLKNPESLDFRILKNSPCVNTGTPLPASDPHGPRADIGAFAQDLSTKGYKDGVKIWPNPASEKVNIRMLETYDELEVVDLSGSLLMKIIILDQPYLYLDISNLNSGYYYFRFISNDKNSTVTLSVF